MKEKKIFLVTDSRFKYIGLILLIMFLVFMFLLFLKTNELTHNPCQLCSEKMGSEITCYSGTMQRIYYPDFTIIDSPIGG